MKIKYLAIVLLTSILICGPAYSKNDKSKGKNKQLPPGLQKNYTQGKPLPPGWQKKLSKGDFLDDSIYARGKVIVPLGKDGTISIRVDGTTLRLHEKTRKILDIFD